jgi:hypothetical protein
MASFAARATSGSGSGSVSASSASSAALLRFRPRFPWPLVASFAARVAHATSMSSMLLSSNLPPHLLGALSSLSLELSAVA